MIHNTITVTQIIEELIDSLPNPNKENGNSSLTPCPVKEAV